MKWLDEDIIITVNNLRIDNSKLYVYKVYEGTSPAKLLFAGQIYLNQGQTSADIDIKDIIAGQKWNAPTLNDEAYDDFNPIYLIQDYYVVINDEHSYEEEAEWPSANTTVYLAYRYSNRKWKEGDIELIDQAPTFSLLTQGYNSITKECPIIPHYPYLLTDKYNFEYAYYNGFSRSTYYTVFNAPLIKDDVRNSYLNQSRNYSISLADLFNESEWNTDPIIVKDVLSETTVKPLKFTGSNYSYSLSIPEEAVGNTIQIVYTDNEYKDIIVDKINVDDKADRQYKVRLDHILTGKEVYKLQYYVNNSIKGQLNIENSNLYSSTGEIVLDLIFYSDVFSGNLNITVNIQKLTVSAKNNAESAIIEIQHTDQGQTKKVKDFTAAIIDFCPKRYYLQWQDRLGSIQSQGFNGNETYSEDITASEIQTYRQQRRLRNLQIQPKWLINSGWLNEEDYYIYESIYTSKYLKLYDTKYNQAYKVILTNRSYTEKTFNNQGRELFNLQLELELSNKQNMIF